MKNSVLIALLTGLLFFALAAEATQTNPVNLTPGVTIPNANPVGISESFDITGATGVVQDVSINLNISGGFNGNLYAYLTGPEGQLAVLFNRVGVTAGNPYGYFDSGFNLTLDGAATNNIHDYQSIGYSTSSGQVTGIWQADGRNISPTNSGSVFDSAPTTSGLNVFQGTAATGVWTLFVAEFGSAGDTVTLNDAGITVLTAPEPGTWALLGTGVAVMYFWRRQAGAKAKSQA